jgi:hypothetical protein
MAPEATLPHGDVNVPGDYFSLAGFEVIMHGRFWVLTEDAASSRPHEYEHSTSYYRVTTIALQSRQIHASLANIRVVGQNR